MTKGREEEQHQVAFVEWFRLQYPLYKDMLTLASIGENVGAIRMHRLKEMGLTPGYPDIMICIPVGVASKPCNSGWSYYPGLFIEMKSRKGKVQTHQGVIHRQLREKGYKVEVAFNWEQAKDYVLDYLNKK